MNGIKVLTTEEGDTTSVTNMFEVFFSCFVVSGLVLPLSHGRVCPSCAGLRRGEMSGRQQ